MISDERNCALGLDALLEQDVSSYEYFHALPQAVQRKLQAKDIRSFDEMQDVVERLRAEN